MDDFFDYEDYYDGYHNYSDSDDDYHHMWLDYCGSGSDYDDSGDDSYSSDDDDDDDYMSENEHTEPAATAAEDKDPTKFENVPSLMDLCALTIAKSYELQIDLLNPPLEEHLLQKICYWSFPWNLKQIESQVTLSQNKHVWSRGRRLVKKVVSMQQVGFMATAVIKRNISDNPKEDEVRVTLTFSKQELTESSCSKPSCSGHVWCMHVVAALCYRVQHQDKVDVYAPMSEVLWNLDRHQLQKLVQLLVDDDPAKHLGFAFKYIKALRDTKSYLSRLGGAPDPTHGPDPGDTQSKWQDTLDSLDKSIRSKIINHSNGISENYDLALKAFCGLHEHLKKVVPFIQGDHIRGAVEILQKITLSLQNLSSSQVNKLAWGLKDIDRFYATLIVFINPKHAEIFPFIRENLTKAQQLLTSKFADLKRCSSSECAEAPRLHNLITVDMVDEAGRDWLFPEAMAAMKVPPPPESFIQLTEGVVKPESSDYEEPLEIMILRLEAQKYFSEPNMASSQNISRKLIHDLSHQLLDFSVMMKRFPTNTFECMCKPSDTDHDMIDVEPEAHDTMELSDTCVNVTDQKKVKVIYSLLLTLWYYNEHNISSESGQLLVSAYLAAELSPFCLASASSTFEKPWITKLVGAILTYCMVPKMDDEHCDDAICRNYVGAIYHHGKSTYGRNYPLQLVCLIVSAGVSVDKDMLRGVQLFRICVEVLVSQQNTLGVEEMTARSAIADHCLAMCEAEIDMFGNTLLELIEVFKRDNDFPSIIKVFTIWEGSRNSNFVKKGTSIQRSLFDLVVHLHTEDARMAMGYNQALTIDRTLEKFLSRFNSNCLQCSQGKWAERIKPDKICAFLMKMKTHQRAIDLNRMPDRVVLTVEQYLASPDHDLIQNFSWLARHLQHEGPHFKRILKAVLDSQSKLYSVGSLIIITLSFLNNDYKAKNKSGKGKDYCMNSWIMPLVLKTLAVSGTEPVSDFEIKDFFNKVLTSCLDPSLSSFSKTGFLLQVLDALGTNPQNSHLLCTLIDKLSRAGNILQDVIMEKKILSTCLKATSYYASSGCLSKNKKDALAFVDIVFFLSSHLDQENPQHKTEAVKVMYLSKEIEDKSVLSRLVDPISNVVVRFAGEPGVQKVFIELSLHMKQFCEDAEEMLKLVSLFDKKSCGDFNIDSLDLTDDQIGPVLSHLEHLLDEKVSEKTFQMCKKYFSLASHDPSGVAAILNHLEADSEKFQAVAEIVSQAPLSAFTADSYWLFFTKLTSLNSPASSSAVMSGGVQYTMNDLAFSIMCKAVSYCGETISDDKLEMVAKSCVNACLSPNCQDQYVGKLLRHFSGKGLQELDVFLAVFVALQDVKRTDVDRCTSSIAAQTRKDFIDSTKSYVIDLVTRSGWSSHRTDIISYLHRARMVFRKGIDKSYKSYFDAVIIPVTEQCAQNRRFCSKIRNVFDPYKNSG